MRIYVNYQFENGLAIVTIDNPPVNALTKSVGNELLEVFKELSTLEFEDSCFKKSRVEVVILTAVAHKGCFIAGADIKSFLELKTREDGEELSCFYQKVTNSIANFERPVICAVNGFALGGGTEVALACDIRIASANALFGLTEVRWGVLPGGGGTQRLPRLIGPGYAKRMILTGERIDAEEALRIGLIERLVPEGEALSEAKKMARDIVDNGFNAVKCAKMGMDEGLNLKLTEGLLIEQRVLGMICESGEPLEGARAFLEKRKPQFKGK
jgi:enoyl-CoA hydratase